VNGADGRKMSKSWGNVVDPVQMLKTHSADTLRYFMLREGSFGSDFSFSEASLLDRHDSELAANLGNLASRGLSLCVQYCGGKVPSEEATQLFDPKELAAKVEKEFSALQIQSAIQEVFAQLSAVNKWLTDSAPWHLKGDDALAKKRGVVRTLLESLYIASHFIAPFMPNAIGDLFERLGNKPVSIPELLKGGWSNLKVDSVVTSGAAMFPRIGDSRFVKKEKAAVASSSIDVSRLDLRVGKIESVEKHPDADHLYIEQINVGEPKLRQVCSGLAKFIPIEEMKDRNVVVICNMKPSNFRGKRSEAMVLAANSEDGTKVELVDPPTTAAPGTRISADGFPGSPDAELNPKLKVFETLKPDLKSNENRVACFKGVPLKTPEGECTVKTLGNSQLG
jgi:methionyl-tRNA synthetase